MANLDYSLPVDEEGMRIAVAWARQQFATGKHRDPYQQIEQKLLDGDYGPHAMRLWIDLHYPVPDQPID